MSRQNYKYSSLNQYNPTSGNVLYYDLDVIYQSIYNILTTVPTERLFQPEFGCDLESINFELLDNITVETAMYLITNAIERYEPRVRISPLTTVVPYPDRHILELNLYFTVSGIGDTVRNLRATLTK